MSNGRISRDVLNRTFEDALDPHVERSSGPDEKPLELELSPPLPEKLRVYLYSLTDSTRGNEYNVQVIVSSWDGDGGR
ncbi:hypothetical protein [Halorussus caseinilyticus]|uniref:Halobacterial output domain-containing protein n=1 Tax=Halorussus caseinilyticus TaxID=3034025 RepID=A0ABD5WJG3_9EURY